MRLCLYQPEIPQNTGTILRMAACFAVGVDIIEPCSFILNDRRLKRAGMDYLDHVDLMRYGDIDSFLGQAKRVVLLSTKASVSYTDFTYQASDVLMVGRESDGVPEEVEKQISDRVLIPMQPGQRSLNVAISMGMVLGEALRQTGGLNNGY